MLQKAIALIIIPFWCASINTMQMQPHSRGRGCSWMLLISRPSQNVVYFRCPTSGHFLFQVCGQITFMDADCFKLKQSLSRCERRYHIFVVDVSRKTPATANKWEFGVMSCSVNPVKESNLAEGWT